MTPYETLALIVAEQRAKIDLLNADIRAKAINLKTAYSELENADKVIAKLRATLERARLQIHESDGHNLNTEWMRPFLVEHWAALKEETK